MPFAALCRAYFSEAGKCASCHSPTGDLAGIAKKYATLFLDITGLFMLRYLFEHGMGGVAAEHRLYTTFLASAFRSLRFGVTDTHGKGMALQFNYLADQGGFEPGRHLRCGLRQDQAGRAT